MDLIRTRDVGAWNECVAIDPRNEAAPLNGYEWGIPQTPSIIQARLEHNRSVRSHGLDAIILRLDMWGMSTSVFPTFRLARRYADSNYGEVWLHDEDGGDPHVFQEHRHPIAVLVEAEDRAYLWAHGVQRPYNPTLEWELPFCHYPYEPYTLCTPGQRDRLQEREHC